MRDLFQQWQDGDVTDLEALRALWSDLREVESSIAPLEAERQTLRERIGLIVARTGPVQLAGFGKAQITNPSVSAGYDTKKLDSVLAELAQSYPHAASLVAACRKETARAGGLRIETEKP